MQETGTAEFLPGREVEIVTTFADLARELRLPELNWNFSHTREEVVVEGRPRAAGDLIACARWARFLGMSAVHADADGRGDCWLGLNGPWTLEIFAEVL